MREFCHWPFESEHFKLKKDISRSFRIKTCTRKNTYLRFLHTLNDVMNHVALSPSTLRGNVESMNCHSLFNHQMPQQLKHVNPYHPKHNVHFIISCVFSLLTFILIKNSMDLNKMYQKLLVCSDIFNSSLIHYHTDEWRVTFHLHIWIWPSF